MHPGAPGEEQSWFPPGSSLQPTAHSPQPAVQTPTWFGKKHRGGTVFEQDFKKHQFGYGFLTVLITWEERTGFKTIMQALQAAHSGCNGEIRECNIILTETAVN